MLLASLVEIVAGRDAVNPEAAPFAPSRRHRAASRGGSAEPREEDSRMGSSRSRRAAVAEYERVVRAWTDTHQALKDADARIAHIEDELRTAGVTDFTAQVPRPFAALASERFSLLIRRHEHWLRLSELAFELTAKRPAEEPKPRRITPKGTGARKVIRPRPKI